MTIIIYEYVYHCTLQNIIYTHSRTETETPHAMQSSITLDHLPTTAGVDNDKREYHVGNEYSFRVRENPTDGRKRRFLRGHFVGRLVSFSPKVFTDKRKNEYSCTLTFDPVRIPNDKDFRQGFVEYAQNTIRFETYPSRVIGEKYEYYIGDGDYTFYPVVAV